MNEAINYKDYPLSQGQKALWFIQRLNPESAAYNFVHAARIPAELDIAALQQALNKLVDRHPALRTTFPTLKGEPVQRIYETKDILISLEDASAWSEASLNKRLAEEIYRPFDLANGPLARMFLFTRSSQEHLALLAMHHIVTDMWSLAIFLYELGVLYTSEIIGVPPFLRPISVTYSDIVRQQGEMLAGPEGERHWRYWEKQLAGELPVLDLPTDRPRPPVLTDRGAAKTHRIDAGLTQKLMSLAQTHGATLQMVLLAAYQLLLHRYSGQDRILVISPAAGRSRQAADLIGYFVNPIILKADLSGNPTFTQFLEQVRQTTMEAFDHSGYPFPLLVERLQPARDPSRSPLAQVVFAWQKTTNMVSSQAMTSFALGEESGGRLQLGKLVLESVALEHRVVPYDLHLYMGEAGEELVATVEYNTALFDAGTIDRFLANFETLLKGIAADPEKHISLLPILSGEERGLLLVAWNDTQAEYPYDQCSQQIFEAQVDRRPDAIALTFLDQALTYGALNRRANRLAHYLKKLGVGPDTLVGICIERSPDMILAVLGTLKAGGAFVPLDPTYPPERLSFMIADAQMPVLLTHAHLVKDLPLSDHSSLNSNPKVVCLDDDWALISEESEACPVSASLPDNLAYAIYTSGSTGLPKGTLLPHRGLCNFITAYSQKMGVVPGSHVLQFSSFSFDASVAEIFMALLSGGTLCLAPRETLLSPETLLKLLREQEVTAAIIPPAMLSVLPPADLPAFANLMSAGEACSPELVMSWAPKRRFFNGYGPTEASVGPTIYEVGSADYTETNIPIGRPIKNIQVYLLDEHLQPVPRGVPGEVHIGGVGLARGYLNRPELTAEKFIPHPFSTQPGARLYRVGDLARYRPDGNLEFLGRIDQQVKIRGFRVELGELEARLEQHDGIRTAVVLAKETAPGEKRLVAYLTAESSAPPASELRDFLRQSVPDYMIPTDFIRMEDLPLTPNGKVDRRALSALPTTNGARPELDANYVAPQSELEQTLAGLWQEALEIDRVGVHDNFFELGGHSLKLARIHSQLQELLNRDISMVELFKYPTIRSLSNYLLSQSEDELSAVQESYARAVRQREAIHLQQQRLKKRRQVS